MSRYPEPFALIGPPLSLLFFAALVANGQRVLLLTRPTLTDNACALSPLLAEDGMRVRRHFSGAEDTPRGSAIVTPVMMEPQDVFGAATRLAPEYRNQVRTRHRLLTTPGIKGGNENRSQG